MPAIPVIPVPSTSRTTRPAMTFAELDSYRRERAMFVNGSHLRFPVTALFSCHDCDTNERPISGVDFIRSQSNFHGSRFHNSVHLCVCTDCTDSCEWCGDVARLSEQDSDEDPVLCPDCRDNTFTCENCSVIGHLDNSNQVSDYSNDHYCNRCWRDLFSRCDDCGDYYLDYNGPECDCSNDRGLIIDYGAMRSDDDRVFHLTGGKIIRGQYAFNRSLFSSEPTMGFEAECESEGNDRYEGAELFRGMIEREHLYIKEDSSLSDGMEIVSQPHTLAAFRNEFDWQPFRDLSSMGFRAYKYHDLSKYGHSVGFHVHISRNSFYTKDLHARTNASPHMYGFLSFIYNNVTAVERISSRNSSTYGEITTTELDNIYDYSRHRGSGRRGVAVNCNNRWTLELRCFAGALNPDRALGYLEFVHAVWAYTKTDRVAKMSGANKMGFLEFTRWAEERPEYSNLVALIEKTNANNL